MFGFSQREKEEGEAIRASFNAKLVRQLAENLEEIPPVGASSQQLWNRKPLPPRQVERKHRLGRKNEL